MQQYLEFEELKNGNLKIILTNEGREFLEEGYMKDRAYIGVWDDLTEYQRCNGSYHMVLPEETGSLTDSPIICDDSFIDDYGYRQFYKDSKIWWFPDYQIINELDKLLDNGYVIFQKA